MLDSLRLWTGWHLTALVLVMVAALLLGGVGLEVTPGDGAWWAARPIWFARYIAALVRFGPAYDLPRRVR